jgi:hypothetical protein
MDDLTAGLIQKNEGTRKERSPNKRKQKRTIFDATFLIERKYTRG